MYEFYNGSTRLVSALQDRKDDSVAIQYIAHALNYSPKQLMQDIQALSDRCEIDKAFVRKLV